MWFKKQTNKANSKPMKTTKICYASLESSSDVYKRKQITAEGTIVVLIRNKKSKQNTNQPTNQSSCQPKKTTNQSSCQPKKTPQICLTSLERSWDVSKPKQTTAEGTTGYLEIKGSGVNSQHPGGSGEQCKHQDTLLYRNGWNLFWKCRC